MITMETLKGSVQGMLDDLVKDRQNSISGPKNLSTVEMSFLNGQISALEWVLKEMDHE